MRAGSATPDRKRGERARPEPATTAASGRLPRDQPAVSRNPTMAVSLGHRVCYAEHSYSRDHGGSRSMPRATPNCRSPLASRHAIMIWRALSRSSAPAAEGHPDYFATEAHYLSVAHRILAALHTGGFVLVTGDPPAVP